MSSISITIDSVYGYYSRNRKCVIYSNGSSGTSTFGGTFPSFANSQYNKIVHSIDPLTAYNWGWISEQELLADIPCLNETVRAAILLALRAA